MWEEVADMLDMGRDARERHHEVALNDILKNDQHRDGGYVRHKTGLDPRVMQSVALLNQASTMNVMFQ